MYAIHSHQEISKEQWQKLYKTFECCYLTQKNNISLLLIEKIYKNDFNNLTIKQKINILNYLPEELPEKQKLFAKNYIITLPNLLKVSTITNKKINNINHIKTKI
jgi:Ca2+-binding EF-hand superfamily protein